MKTKSKRQRYLGYAALLFASALVVSAVIWALDVWDRQRTFSGVESGTGVAEDGTVYLDGKEYVRKDSKDNSIETLLVLGLDTFDGASSDSYTNDRQADFLMLFVIDNNAKTCTAVHINRDAMVEMNVLGVDGEKKVGTTTGQIALAHTYGNGKETSCRNTADAVSKLLLNSPIVNYISVTMDAVPEYTNLLDGVTVEVLDDFSGIDETLVKGATVTLKGERALTYVRTRYGMEDSTNEARMVRQRQFLRAMYEKTRECMDAQEGFVTTAFSQMKPYIVYSGTEDRLKTLFEKISTYELQDIRSLEGESRMGEQYIEFYPDNNALIKLVVDLFYEPKK